MCSPSIVPRRRCLRSEGARAEETFALSPTPGSRATERRWAVPEGEDTSDNEQERDSGDQTLSHARSCYLVLLTLYTASCYTQETKLLPAMVHRVFQTPNRLTPGPHCPNPPPTLIVQKHSLDLAKDSPTESSTGKRPSQQSCNTQGPCSQFLGCSY